MSSCGPKQTSTTKKSITDVRPINTSANSGRGNAFSFVNVQKHQGDTGCPQTQTACRCTHRDHYRLAAYFDRPLYRRGIVGRSYLEPYTTKTMKYLVPALHDLGEMQAIEISRDVLQQQRRRPGLT
jgi:hypothetical protein